MHVFILGAKSTPIGSFHGSLAGHTAAELGGHAISAAVEDSGINPAHIDEILLGCVVGAGTPYRFDGQPFDRDASPCTPDNGRQVEG